MEKIDKVFMTAVVIIILLLSIPFCRCGLDLMITDDETQKYDICTDLGDNLTLEVSLESPVFRGTYLYYVIYSNEKIGGATISDRSRSNIPENPVNEIVTLGHYGNTNFYECMNQIIYIQKGIKMDKIPMDFDLDNYQSRLMFYDDENQRQTYTEHMLNLLSDLMDSYRFDYIHQFGEILAYEHSEKMEDLLQKYAAREFTDEELEINTHSKITPEHMTIWAKAMLKKYY